MKTRDEFDRRCAAYLHDELSADEKERFEDFLEAHEAERAEFEARRATLELLSDALAAAPAPRALAPWDLIPRKRTSPLRAYLRGPRLKAVLASGAAFALLLMLSLRVVVVEPSRVNEEPEGAAIVFERSASREAERPLRRRSAPVADFALPKMVAREWDTERYDRLAENAFQTPLDQPLSTFSIDVDRAAYANVRRFLADDRLPPPDAVRIEEMVNYFDYDYPAPNDGAPFVVSTEFADCPWNPAHRLALIGLRGARVEAKDLPPNNLVFLLDVSDSMSAPDKLPLLKSALSLLADQLRPEDSLSIVVYSGAEGLVLRPTNNKHAIRMALDRLEAGGATAGSEGIELAYETAAKAFIENGNNRVILATDGDFNLGASSEVDLTRLIEEKRGTGVYLSVLGFGSDAKMENLAARGNGNYADIDDMLQARKTLATEMGGALHVIAEDVKVQIEFNPREVKGYRLIGYENRGLAAADFANDAEDAGELGAGHSVTALYELILADSDEAVPRAGALKYQKPRLTDSHELMTVKLRYKRPGDEISRLITETVDSADFDAPERNANIGFASAVAEFGLLLRDSEFKGAANYDDLIERARAFRGEDAEGDRSEFIRMVEKARLLAD